MSKVFEIQNILYLYNLADEKYENFKLLSNINYNILRRSILIGEGLDYEILLDLDKTGKGKLTYQVAESLAKNIINMNEQIELYEKIKGKKDKDKLLLIKGAMECMICCESKPLKEIMKCCENKICQPCLLTILRKDLANYYFKGCKCPYCNEYLSIEYIRYLINDIKYDTKTNWLSSYYDYEPWRYTKYYKKKEFMKDSDKILYYNIYSYYLKNIHIIENVQNKVVYDQVTNIDYLLEPIDNELAKIYGECFICCNQMHKILNRRRPQHYNRLNLGNINKECVNQDGELLNITPDLFKCVVCKSREEETDNIIIKKCPHCGVRNMKPDGCNFVVCGDHRWCWTCEERLENNNDGHNTHYYIGPGSSAYSDKCRVSIGSDAPTFTINGKCKCSSCKKHGGGALCRTSECMNRTTFMPNKKFNKYCDYCQEDIDDLLAE